MERASFKIIYISVLKKTHLALHYKKLLKTKYLLHKVHLNISFHNGILHQKILSNNEILYNQAEILIQKHLFIYQNNIKFQLSSYYNNKKIINNILYNKKDLSLIGQIQILNQIKQS